MQFTCHMSHVMWVSVLVAQASNDCSCKWGDCYQCSKCFVAAFPGVVFTLVTCIYVCHVICLAIQVEHVKLEYLHVALLLTFSMGFPAVSSIFHRFSSCSLQLYLQRDLYVDV